MRGRGERLRTLPAVACVLLLALATADARAELEAYRFPALVDEFLGPNPTRTAAADARFDARFSGLYGMRNRFDLYHGWANAAAQLAVYTRNPNTPVYLFGRDAEPIYFIAKAMGLTNVHFINVPRAVRDQLVDPTTPVTTRNALRARVQRYLAQVGLTEAALDANPSLRPVLMDTGFRYQLQTDLVNGLFPAHAERFLGQLLVSTNPRAPSSRSFLLEILGAEHHSIVPPRYNVLLMRLERLVPKTNHRAVDYELRDGVMVPVSPPTGAGNEARNVNPEEAARFYADLLHWLRNGRITLPRGHTRTVADHFRETRTLWHDLGALLTGNRQTLIARVQALRISSDPRREAILRDFLELATRNFGFGVQPSDVGLPALFAPSTNSAVGRPTTLHEWALIAENRLHLPPLSADLLLREQQLERRRLLRIEALEHIVAQYGPSPQIAETLLLMLADTDLDIREAAATHLTSNRISSATSVWSFVEILSGRTALTAFPEALRGEYSREQAFLQSLLAAAVHSRETPEIGEALLGFLQGRHTFALGRPVTATEAQELRLQALGLLALEMPTSVPARELMAELLRWPPPPADSPQAGLVARDQLRLMAFEHLRRTGANRPEFVQLAAFLTADRSTQVTAAAWDFVTRAPGSLLPHVVTGIERARNELARRDTPTSRGRLADLNRFLATIADNRPTLHARIHEILASGSPCNAPLARVP